METKISEKLMAMGITPNLRGFHYLKDAVSLVDEDKTYLFAMVKRLYPEMARKYHVKWQNVERAMRHAISKTGNKMKVGEFIGVLVETLEK